MPCRLLSIFLTLTLLPLLAFGQEKVAPRTMPVKIVLFPLREAVLSSTVSAKVLEYKIQEGQSFRANEIIVSLDDRSYRQAYLKANALAEEAKASQKFASASLKRTQDTFAKDAIGLQELEQGALDKYLADAKAQFALASLELASIELDACSVKVPFDGRLTKRIAKENEFVAAGQPLLEVIDDGKLLAVMHLPSEKRSTLKLNDELEFKVDETSSIHKGKVFEISGRINYESRTFEVKVIVDNSDSKLAAGMSGVLESSEGH